MKDGTVTAGNAPGLNDGGAALVLMSEDKSKSRRKKTISLHFGADSDCGRTENFPQTPGYAINEFLKKTGKTLEEIDLFEINEAFAAVALACTQIAGSR